MRAHGTAKALALFFFLALTWPFLGLADAAESVLGFPSLLVYIFWEWGLLVLALLAVSRKLGN